MENQLTIVALWAGFVEARIGSEPVKGESTPFARP